MTLRPADAERLLFARYGDPAKPTSDYVIGFRNPVGRVLAIHRTIQETRIWFQPPAPPPLAGVTFLPDRPRPAPGINSAWIERAVSAVSLTLRYSGGAG